MWGSPERMGCPHRQQASMLIVICIFSNLSFLYIGGVASKRSEAPPFSMEPTGPRVAASGEPSKRRCP